MKLIFCIEKSKGMMFFGKRHSSDKKLRDKILFLSASNKLWVSSYTAKQFEDQSKIVIDNEYQNKAGESDYCFVEDLPYTVDGVTEIVLCHWNRKYPSDKFFDIDLKAEGFKKVSKEDIAGSSHEKITIEVWRREQ